MAAIYLAEYYWEDGDAGRKLADDFVEKYSRVWEANPDLSGRAGQLLGRVFSAITRLQDVTFVDTTGKRWTSEDFRGKNTLFVFFLPHGRQVLDEIGQAWHGKAQIVGVPVGTGPLAPGKGQVVDRDRSNVEKLMTNLGARGVPSTVLVTPSLRVINNVDQIRECLNEHGP